MRRASGWALIVIGVLVALLGVALAIQMVGHADWWQVAALGVLALTIGFLLLRTGRRVRA
ncbi:MAG TPA: hypothetical protein VJA44_04560 [Acidimicrobiia bacterium]|nr:hypothetical protein [Acidimicrobiia bacterium]